MTLLSPLSRRAFLVSSGLGFAAEALAARIADADELGGGPCAAAQAHAVLADAAEPGVRMVVRGRLFAPDGERPAAGVIVYAYQTDAKGVYAPQQSAPPRLRAFMKTDAEGRFRYETIRPGSYPGTRNPAHVHHQAWGGGWLPQWLAELNFADDPFVSAENRDRSAAASRFAWVQTPRKEGDVLGIDLNLRLKAEGASFGANVLHGREACGLR
jgi:protocatechuate 3,4-dioxygenase beta subunit